MVDCGGSCTVLVAAATAALTGSTTAGQTVVQATALEHNPVCPNNPACNDGRFFYFDVASWPCSTNVCGYKGKQVYQYRSGKLIWSGMAMLWNDDGQGPHGRRLHGEAARHFKVGDVLEYSARRHTGDAVNYGDAQQCKHAYIAVLTALGKGEPGKFVISLAYSFIDEKTPKSSPNAVMVSHNQAFNIACLAVGAKCAWPYKFTLEGSSVPGYTASVELTSLVLDGFTGRNGGTVLHSTGGNTVFRNCTFSNNHPGSAHGHGGALFMLGGRSLITDTRFENNMAGIYGPSGYKGGAIYSSGCDMTIKRTVFLKNSLGKPNGGAAIYTFGNTVVLDHCTFDGHTGPFVGTPRRPSRLAANRSSGARATAQPPPAPSPRHAPRARAFARSRRHDLLSGRIPDRQQLQVHQQPLQQKWSRCCDSSCRRVAGHGYHHDRQQRGRHWHRRCHRNHGYNRDHQQQLVHTEPCSLRGKHARQTRHIYSISCAAGQLPRRPLTWAVFRVRQYAAALWVNSKSKVDIKDSQFTNNAAKVLNCTARRIACLELLLRPVARCRVVRLPVTRSCVGAGTDWQGSCNRRGTCTQQSACSSDSAAEGCVQTKRPRLVQVRQYSSRTNFLDVQTKRPRTYFVIIFDELS